MEFIAEWKTEVEQGTANLNQECQGKGQLPSHRAKVLLAEIFRQAQEESRGIQHFQGKLEDSQWLEMKVIGEGQEESSQIPQDPLSLS